MSDASWAALTLTEREKLAACETSCAVLVEEARLFARLAEELQRRLSDLEAEVSALVAPVDGVLT